MKRKTMNQLMRVTLLIVLLFTSIALQAKDVEFDFKANPWGLPVAPKFGEPEEGKLDNDKLYKSKAKGLVLKYKNSTSRTRLTKIIVHLEPNDITGITHQPLNSDVNEIVYSLDGIRVGTTKDFHLLSKGIYIVGRKKVQKY